MCVTADLWCLQTGEHPGTELQPHAGRTKVGIALLPAKAGWAQEEGPRRSPKVLGKG